MCKTPFQIIDITPMGLLKSKTVAGSWDYVVTELEHVLSKNLRTRFQSYAQSLQAKIWQIEIDSRRSVVSWNITKLRVRDINLKS